jgi:hypothetical protein
VSHCRVIVEYHSSNVVCSCHGIDSIEFSLLVVHCAPYGPIHRPRPESALKLRTRPARGRPPHPPRLPSVRVRAPGEGVRLAGSPAPPARCGRPAVGPVGLAVGVRLGAAGAGPRLKPYGLPMPIAGNAVFGFCFWLARRRAYITQPAPSGTTLQRFNYSQLELSSNSPMYSNSSR